MEFGDWRYRPGPKTQAGVNCQLPLFSSTYNAAIAPFNHDLLWAGAGVHPLAIGGTTSECISRTSFVELDLPRWLDVLRIGRGESLLALLPVRSLGILAIGQPIRCKGHHADLGEGEYGRSTSHHVIYSFFSQTFRMAILPVPSISNPIKPLLRNLVGSSSIRMAITCPFTMWVVVLPRAMRWS